MKKKIIILCLLYSYMTIVPCQVILKNDTERKVTVMDMEAKTPAQLVNKGKTISANKNPDKHADLRIIIGDSPRQRIYRLNQIACSGTHEIPIATTTIIKGTLDNKLFTLKEEK